MALLNGNTMTIAGTDKTLTNVFIICKQPGVHVVSPLTVEITITYQCYTAPEKWIEKPINNMLKIEGLVKRNFVVDYDRANNGDIFEFIDIKTKEDLLLAFPDCDPDLITFVPPHAIAE